MNKESYQPSEEEIKKAEEMMTEEQKNRSVEREETIKAAGGKIEDKNLKTKIEKLNKIILKQQDSFFEPGGGYEIAVKLKSNRLIVGVSSSAIINDEGGGEFRLRNPRTHQFYNIPIESIENIKLAGKASWDLSEKETILWENKD